MSLYEAILPIPVQDRMAFSYKPILQECDIDFQWGSSLLRIRPDRAVAFIGITSTRYLNQNLNCQFRFHEMLVKEV